jgi:hypothetical protein
MRTPKDPLAILRDFEDNPLRAGHDLRLALRSDCGAFLNALLNDSAFGNHDPRFRLVIDLLLNSDVFIHAIATPSIISFDHALRLTRYVLEVDGAFVNTLLTALLTRQDLSDPACTLRVLDLIGECAAQLTNWRSLLSIHADGDPRIKAKCAVLLARYRFGDEAGLERFRRSEPRVRANIVETIGEADRDTANAVLELAIRDEDNRVAGNACLALYNSGDTRSLARLAEMIASPEPKHRITAAWVIGQCRDGRFASRLLAALRGELPALRKRSLASLARLEPIPAAPSGSAALELCFVSAPQPDDGYELWLQVAGQSGEPAPGLRPIDFFIWAGAEYLLDYSVEESIQASAAAVRIVYPANSDSFERALAASLAQKPAEQCWAFSSYGAASAKPAPAADPRLEADAATLAALLESGPALSSEPMEAVNKALAPESALDEQHLVLLLDGSAVDLESVRSLCAAKKIRLHCWHVSANNTSTNNINANNSGPVGVFRTEEQAAAIWPRFVSAIAARYTLHAGRVPTAAAVRDASVKPARFSGRADLLKGGQSA